MVTEKVRGRISCKIKQGVRKGNMEIKLNTHLLCLEGNPFHFDHRISDSTEKGI